MNVLVVDDRAENRVILQVKMTAAGYTVTVAANGVEALQRLRTGPYDIVVTDLMMPQMDGYQLTHAIKTDDALKHVPVLVFTATYMDAKDEALAYNLGADGFVRKPASDEEFFSTVRRLLDRAHRGELSVRKPSPEELTYLREYTERLIHKLEDKVLQLESAEQRLRDLNATLEARIAESTRELRRANEDLEAFAYSVSHDLRAPLRSIQGYAAALRSDEPPLDPADRIRFFERIEAIAAETQDLITELLRYAQLKTAALPATAVRLDGVVAAAIKHIEPDRRANGDLAVGALGFEVMAHEPTLVQVLQNLIGNALKFTRPGERAEVTVEAESRGPMIRCSVRDRGIGIAPQHRERIFKVFERLHGKTLYPGSGVGLAIVQRAIEKMGGTVGVESQPDNGSTFWFELPAAPAVAQPATG